MKRIAAITKVFDTLYNRPFDYSVFNDRLLIQKTIYILQEMGMSIGDYSFKWHKYGPYSQSVQDDGFRLLSTQADGMIQIRFTDYGISILDNFRTLLNQKPHSVSTERWLEAVASIHYIKRNCLPLAADNELVDELIKRKPHFNDRGLVNLAVASANEISVPHES